MFRIHRANLSRKWRLIIKTPKKSNLTLSTYVQYIEDFKFWVNVAERPQRKNFVSELKLDIFREDVYSRTFETLDDVVREAREELSTYRYFRNFGSCPEEISAEKGVWQRKMRLSPKYGNFRLFPEEK